MCQEENSKEQMADKMRDVVLEGSHAGRHVALVQFVGYNCFFGKFRDKENAPP